MREKYEGERSANEYAANHYGSELCAGGMERAEQMILDEIREVEADVKILEDYLFDRIRRDSSHEENLKEQVRNIENDEAMLAKRKEAMQAEIRRYDRLYTLLL